MNPSDVNELIAAALERVASGMPMDFTRGSLEGTAMWLRGHPAELRAAKPASEPKCECPDDASPNSWRCPVHDKPAPQPSLVERLRTKSFTANWADNALLREAADAIKAAQAEVAELREWRRIGRESADKLSEEFNRARELEAQRVAAQATDPNVESVRAKLAQRSAVGIAKYGCDTTRPDLSTIDWLNHLQEELMDAAVYVERLLALAATMERKS